LIEKFPDFSDQVNSYATSMFNISRPLAIIQFVGNDLVSENITPEKVASDIEEQLQSLVAIGEISHLLILESSIVSYVEAGFNSALVTMINRFQAKHESKILIRSVPILKLHALMAKVPPPTADYGKWHHPNDSCYNKKTTTLCTDPQNYFKFDLYHTSTVPNYNLARYLGHQIQNLYWY